MKIILPDSTMLLFQVIPYRIHYAMSIGPDLPLVPERMG